MATSTSRRFFAVGLSKDWVEVREATKPPTKHTSKAERLVNVEEIQYSIVYDDYWGQDRRVPKKVKVTKKLVIDATNYVGGKVVKVLKADSFARKFKVRVLKGNLLEMSPTMIKQLKLEKE